MPAPDHRRIHELEYELGLRDDAPEPDLTIGPQTAISADAILKETYAPTTLALILRQVWTDDLATSETGEIGTRILRDEREPMTYAIATDGFEHVTRIRIEPSALARVGDRTAITAINRQFGDALKQHRDAIRKERLATAADRVAATQRAEPKAA